MISPTEIKKKAEKKYLDFLQSCVENKDFESLTIWGDKSYNKNSFADFEKEIQLILSQSKSKIGFGYSLDFQKINTKFLGTQDLPSSIYFETEKDFLKFLGKENEVKFFKKNVEMMTKAFPQLKTWIIKNPKKVIENGSQWENLLKVCQYFYQNPTPNLYIRELLINIHTKFIEQYQHIIKDLLDFLIPEHININGKNFEERFWLKYAEPQIRFKILDKEISQKYLLGIDDLAIPISQFENLHLPIQRVLVVENKTSLYATLTLPKMAATMAIFGGGKAVALLKNTSWLHKTELLYWGDIDVQGFEILSQFKTYFPQTKSILMDKKTFDKFFENEQGKPTNNNPQLQLTASEQELYELLKTNNWRLEQEKISLDYVNQHFEKEINIFL